MKQQIDLGFAFLRGQDGLVKVEHQAADTASLPHLPEVSRNVEHDSLKEQNEAHPLVVFVVDAFLARCILVDAWVWHLGAHLFVHRIGESERSMDPAVRVQQRRGYIISLDAVDRVAYMSK